MSGTEIIVILLLALVVLGPEKLPDAIRKFGKTYAELKKMGTGFQQEFKSAIDEPMREMRETADLLKKSVDFSGSSAAPPAQRATTTAPVTDDVIDRPARNEGVAPADPDIVPTDDVPFASEGSEALEEVASNGDDTATVDEVTVAAEEVTVVADDVTVNGADAVDPVRVSDDPQDESADRGEADDA